MSSTPATVDSPSKAASTAETKTPALPPAEREGKLFANRLIAYVSNRKGRFLKDGDNVFVLVDGREIPLSGNSVAFDALLAKTCDISTVSQQGRIAKQRFLIHAYEAAAKTHVRKFSALSEDQRALYVPVTDGSLLQVSQEAIANSPNGTNAEALWIRHPRSKPFSYLPADPQQGLTLFETLLVDSLACKHEHMRWFVAMHEGLFPFVRDLCKSQFIVVHQGSTQQGKTSGAQRYTVLHGLGEVTGDASIAALASEGDVGLLVLDNKEQENMSKELTEYCLFLSTGAGRKRSSSDGSQVRSSEAYRPVGVITSIEGVGIKSELRARMVEVEFAVSGQKVGREEIEKRIGEERDVILSSLMQVLRKFFEIRREQRKTPNLFNGNHSAHFTTLCDLLRAYAVVAGTTEEWAEGMIGDWDRTIRGCEDSQEETSPLEYPIRQLLDQSGPTSNFEFRSFPGLEHRNRVGTLYVIPGVDVLLHKLRSQPALHSVLPTIAQGFGRRLKSERFRAFEVVREEDAPQFREHLKRRAALRPFGIFIPDDSRDEK